MKELARDFQEMESGDISELESKGLYTFVIDGQEVVIELSDVEIISEDIPGWLVGNEDTLTVALDITITKELENEGIARELVNRIQNIRKAKDLQITDRIILSVSSNPLTNEAVDDNSGYIKSQVLADRIEIVEGTLEDEIEIDDVLLTIRVDKNS